MCGIVGALIYQGNSSTVTESFINRMRDAMTHRGPDGASTWLAEDGQLM